MFEEIDIEYLSNHIFESKESEKIKEKSNVAYRFSEGDIIPQSGEEKANIIRKK